MTKVKLVRISHWSDSDENAVDCEIACDCVKRGNVVVGLRKKFFARTHTATHMPTSAQFLIVTTMTPDNRLWSPKAYGLMWQLTPQSLPALP